MLCTTRIIALRILHLWVIFLFHSDNQIELFVFKSLVPNAYLMIYQLHLQLANSWTNLWPHMQHEIEGKLQKECRFRCQTLDNKLRCLIQQQTKSPPHQNTLSTQSRERDWHIFFRTWNGLTTKRPQIQPTQQSQYLDSKPSPWGLSCHITPPPFRMRGVQKTDSRTHQHLTKEQQTLTHTQSTHSESRAIKSIKTKLRDNEAMIIWADKGNS